MQKGLGVVVVGLVVVGAAAVEGPVEGGEVGAGQTVPVVCDWIQALAVETREYTPRHVYTCINKC